MILQNLEGLPENYIEAITGGFKHYNQLLAKEECVYFGICGGCGRKSIVPEYSDVDFFVVTKNSKTQLPRFHHNGIKISCAAVSMNEIQQGIKDLDIKIVYFLRCIERGLSIDFLCPLEMPSFTLDEISQKARDNKYLMGSFEICDTDLSNYVGQPNLCNAIILNKHCHTFMKNWLRANRIELDDYEELNESFFTEYPESKINKVRTPRQYLSNNICHQQIAQESTLFYCSVRASLKRYLKSDKSNEK